MKRSQWVLALIFLSIQSVVVAQQPQPSDSLFSLKRVFGTGQFRVSARQFSMYTHNQNNLTDYYGVAIGAGIRYETKRWRRWQFTFGGYFVNDLYSSDFSVKDPLTNTPSRYDSGLYDVVGVTDKTYLSRVEELHLKFQLNKNALLTWGKQVVRSPLVNPQDGRMTPSMLEGLQLDSKLAPKLSYGVGWYYRASPRSTFKWVPLGSSIGLYPMGVTTDGRKANYLGNLTTRGLLISNLQYTPKPALKMQLWHYYLENISQTAFGQWVHETPALGIGLQALYQTRLGNGGNVSPELAYMSPDTRAAVLSGMVSRQFGKIKGQVNYTRIGKQGRYQFPREWGRDPFFTFLSRERIEGLGDVHAITTNWTWRHPNRRLSIDLSGGYHHLPDVKNAALNKYGMPSYTQINLDVRQRFGGSLEGLELQFLVASKINAGETYNDNRFIINKVNMNNLNLVLNYTFEKK